MTLSLSQSLKRLLRRLFLRVSRFAKQRVIVAERLHLMERLGHCDGDLEIVYPWDIRGERHLFIGQDVFIGPGVLIIAGLGADVHIGNKVMFGPQVKLIASDHNIDDLTRPIKDAGYGEVADICIGHDVWIGSGAIVLKGVHIGDGAVIGAGSVVTRSVGPLEVWAGNPARKLRSRSPAGGPPPGSQHAAGSRHPAS